MKAGCSVACMRTGTCRSAAETREVLGAGWLCWGRYSRKRCGAGWDRGSGWCRLALWGEGQQRVILHRPRQRRCGRRLAVQGEGQQRAMWCRLRQRQTSPCCASSRPPSRPTACYGPMSLPPASTSCAPWRAPSSSPTTTSALALAPSHHPSQDASVFCPLQPPPLQSPGASTNHHERTFAPSHHEMHPCCEVNSPAPPPPPPFPFPRAFNLECL